MLSNWRSWCRLCANECAVYKLESLDELNEITMRHFHFSLQELADVCNCICEECYNFVNKLERFKERCLQTSKMLLEFCASSASDDAELLDSDIQDLRFRFLSDSILAAVEEADSQDVKGFTVSSVVEGAVDGVQASSLASDQEGGVDAGELTEPELVQLKIEKVANRKKRKSSDRLVSNLDESVKESDSVLTRLTVDEFGEFKVDDTLMSNEPEGFDAYDNDYLDEEKPELGSDPDEEELDEEEEEEEEEEEDEEQEEPKPAVSKPRSKARSKPDQQQRVRCEECDKSYASRQMYVLHLQSKHPDSPELRFQCGICPKRFSSEKKTKQHEAVHLPSDQKMVHPCNYCDKKFSKLVNVQAHIKAVHIGERPYVCEECGKAFGTKGALKEHQVTHSDEKPFQCSHCPKKFKNLPRLKTHEDIHTDTLYVCPHCGLQLNTKRTLKMHMVVHSDQKKFKCQYCGNEYKRSKALKNHLILHTGLRPYQCPFCEKTFANGSNCRSHKKKAHPKELAALEASGGQSRATNIPKLNQLQPKSATTTTDQPADPEEPSAIPLTPEEQLVLTRGVRLVTAYFHSTPSEPPPLNILSTGAQTTSTTGIKSEAECLSGAEGGDAGVVIAQVGESMQELVGLPPLQLISSGNL
ncbi:zinc finger protein weckle-like [Culex pipiens pallens]|uniref:zinc finger protein weckle-like n=1 Tax=Culex pipiens pallens TaxID=42434 RepID=UPI0019543AD2|nr:zinc finger protein weckle-like [Culex pipiens pallens]